MSARIQTVEWLNKRIDELEMGMLPVAHYADQQVLKQLARIKPLEDTKADSVRKIYRLVGEMVADNSPEIAYFAQRIQYQIERRFPEIIDWRFKEESTA